MDTNLQKNILDLKYSKYLEYLNISGVTILSYCIAIAIAFFTNQFQDQEILIFAAISLSFGTSITILIFKIKEKLKIIEKEIQFLA